MATTATTAATATRQKLDNQAKNGGDGEMSKNV